jgi:hypothetical protein
MVWSMSQIFGESNCSLLPTYHLHFYGNSTWVKIYRWSIKMHLPFGTMFVLELCG